MTGATRPLPRPLRGADRVARTVCPLCGYDLRGLGEDPTCPECGLPHLSPAVEFHDATQPRRWILIALFLAWGGARWLERSGHGFGAALASVGVILALLGALYSEKSRPRTDAPLRARVGREGLTLILLDGSWRYWRWEQIDEARFSRLTGRIVLQAPSGASLARFTFAPLGDRRRARTFVQQVRDTAVHRTRESASG